MPSSHRLSGGKRASWREGIGIGVDCLLRRIYSFGERGTAIEGDFNLANYQPNLTADRSKRSGRYGLGVAVPI